MQQVTTWTPSKGKLVDYIADAGGSELLPFAGAQVEHLMQPADVKDVALALDAIIETLGCNTPSELALHMYYEILTDQPKILIEKAAIAVLSHYKYKSMPNPADILNALEVYKEKYMGMYNMVTSLIDHAKIIEVNKHNAALADDRVKARINEMKLLQASTSSDTKVNPNEEEDTCL